MDSKNKKCRNCIIKSKAVSILNGDELKILESACAQIEFEKGELIFKEGGLAKYITYIRDGFVKQSKMGLGSKEYILSISTEGAFLGIQNLNKQSKINYVSAYAITQTQVCFLDIDYFIQLLKQNGTFALEVISYIFNDEMNYFDRLLNNVQQQLPGRLANTLLYFYHQVYKENPFCLNITKSEFASLVGTSRESVTRMLKKFQDDGIIHIKKGLVQILDETKLAEIKKKG